MSTIIKLRSSNVADSEADIVQLLADMGFTNPLVGTDKAWTTVKFFEDISAKNIRKVKAALEEAIAIISIEVVETPDLDLVKERYKEVIDQSSERRITELGFEWPPTSGQRFSLSGNAQRKWIGLDLAVTKGAITFPYKVPTRDNDVIHEIQDAAEASNMFLTAIGTVDAILTVGTNTKSDIADAVDQATAYQTAVGFLTAVGHEDLIPKLGE